jgi:hypothetical protein
VCMLRHDAVRRDRGLEGGERRHAVLHPGSAAVRAHGRRGLPQLGEWVPVQPPPQHASEPPWGGGRSPCHLAVGQGERAWQVEEQRCVELLSDEEPMLVRHCLKAYGSPVGGGEEGAARTVGWYICLRGLA